MGRRDSVGSGAECGKGRVLRKDKGGSYSWETAPLGNNKQLTKTA